MMSIVIEQLQFIRGLTIKAVEGTPERKLDIIPEGFNNNVRWNLGHIYVIQEKLAFHFSGEPMVLPDNFTRLFAKGTKPADWNEDPPKLEVLVEMLADQPKRIQQSFHHRLEEKVKEPFTTGSGLTLSTIGELLNFSIYHEGMHFNTINLLKRFSSKS